jgi:small subunit ribosomal protein S16
MTGIISSNRSICWCQKTSSSQVTIPTMIEARVSIRFMRMGRTHKPFYRIIAVDSRKKRDTKPLEFLGWYSPMSKESKLNAPSIKSWLRVGAQPSRTLKRLLDRANITSSTITISQ